MRKTGLSTILIAAITSIGAQSATAAIPSASAAGTYDVVIYGATSAAVAAAVQVKRMGKTVVIVCPEKHLGGLTAGGLGWTD
ncbi:MAG: FAD-dependent oxidoreductase, partial [Sedimentisphaerales bacterium]